MRQNGFIIHQNAKWTLKPGVNVAMTLLTSWCIYRSSLGPHRAHSPEDSVLGMEGNMEEHKDLLGPDSQEGFGTLSQNSFSDFWAAV